MKTGLLTLGFIAGLASAALGIGGGTIIVPGLVFLLRCEIKKVFGLSLAAAIPAVSVGLITHYLINADNIKWQTAAFLVMGSVTGAWLGAALVKKTHSRMLAVLFGILLLATGLKLTGAIEIPIESAIVISAKPLLAVAGLCAGLASSFFGIGGGVVMVPALNLLFGLPIHAAIPTSLAAVLPTVLAGSMFHNKISNINFGLLKFLVPGALIGACAGAFAANILPSNTLKTVFGIAMILSSVKIFTITERKDGV